MSKNISFLINKSEITAGTRGASLGPEAIMTAARKSGSGLFNGRTVEFLPCVNKFLDTETPFRYAKRIDGVLEIYRTLNSTLSQKLNENQFPVILAGDHGSAGGTIAGIKSGFPNKRLGVIWIDAHADIHTPYTTPSGNIHGMPLATALGIDNLECQSNEPDAETVALWEQLKNVGGIYPKINPQDIVYVAVRSTEDEENECIERLAIKEISVGELRENGVAQTVNNILDYLSACDILYISFDVDSMDPDLTSRGTGTPVENGLSPQEAKEMLIQLVKHEKTVCLEVVEVNPCLDDKVNTMAEVTLDILEAVVVEMK
jgi:arginase